MNRTQSQKRGVRWHPFARVIVSLFLLINAVEANSWGRHLQQNEEVIRITVDNVGRLGRLVENAEEDAVFVFTTDVELPSLITVNPSRLTFRGAARNRPTIRCAPEEGAFVVHGNNTVFENLILRDCEETAVLVYDEVAEFNPFDPDSVEELPERLDVVIRRVDFFDNAASGDDADTGAGAFVATELVHASLTECRFEGNTGVRGGAVHFSGSVLSVEDCVFAGNNASSAGGAIFASRDAGESPPLSDTGVTIANCNFTNNRDLEGGEDPIGLTLDQNIRLETNRYLDFPLPTPSAGAVFVAGFHHATFDSSNFTGNSAVPAAGAVFLGDNRRITLGSCRFNGNSAVTPSVATNGNDLQLGGAIFAAFEERESRLEIERCLFANNSASYGGALHFVSPIDSSFRMENCAFESNVATLGGGAVVFRNVGTPEVYSSRFSDNRAFVGGAILVTNAAGLDVVETPRLVPASQFFDNVAYDGGAIFGIGAGTVQLSRVFFERNSAERNGGAVCCIDGKASGSLEIQDARMSRNRARKGGAIYLENVSSFSMRLGVRTTNIEVVRSREVIARNSFERNVALAGGAIYYRASNLLGNSFQLTGGSFSFNRAVSNPSLIHDGPLTFPSLARQDERGARQIDEADAVRLTDAFGRVLLDPRSFEPCEPGGGGAICAVLSGISRRAPVSFEITQSNFTSNSAVVGGALMLSTDPQVDWRVHCNSSMEGTGSVLSSEPCRSLSLRDVRFESNLAEAAGGAIFASNLADVFYSVEQTAEEIDFSTLSEVHDEERFVENDVSESGYGKNVAGTAVRLRIVSPVLNPETALLLSDQSSGRATPLAPIEVEVLDGLRQRISHGIVDSAFSVNANASHPTGGESIASGQVVSRAREGVAKFETLVLTSEPGRYEVSFSVPGTDVEHANGNVTLRECILGERYITNSSICERCPFDKFTFYDEVNDCVDCPEHARCFGGASLIPTKGYWQSSPFSILMHECFHDGACNYDEREDRLKEQRSEQLEEFFDRFGGNRSPIFTNEEYQQCTDGYEGPLCGACQDGYGHADGKSCVKCGSHGATAAIVFLLAIWQLVFLAVTIRNALVSVRDMSQILAIQQHGTVSNPARGSTPPSTGSNINSPQQAVSQQAPSQSPGSGTPHQSQLAEGTASQAAATQQTPNQHAIDKIIAAQHVSETIKIFVNYFQVTSVAVNINLEWTESIKNMLATMNSVAGFSTGASFTSMTCLLERDDEWRSVHGVILRIAFPMCLMAFILAVFWARWLVMRRSPATTRDQCRTFIRCRSTLTFLVVCFFAYQSISEDLMGSVSCIELDAKERSDAERRSNLEAGIDFWKFSIARDRYWTEDTTIECFRKRHAILIAFLGIPGIVFFLCGVPLYLFIFLMRKRKKGELMTVKVLNTYGFIYQNYEDRFVYWEVLILIRKALISAVVVFAYPLGANLQGIMALGILILALAFHLMAVPFKYLPLNVLEGCSLVVSIFTFYAGIVFNDENTTDGGEALLSVLLVLVNATLVVAFCFAICFYADRCVTAKLKIMTVTNIPQNPFARFRLLISSSVHNISKAISVRMSQKSSKPRANARKQRRAQRAQRRARTAASAPSLQPSVDPQHTVVDVGSHATPDNGNP